MHKLANKNLISCIFTFRIQNEVTKKTVLLKKVPFKILYREPERIRKICFVIVVVKTSEVGSVLMSFKEPRSLDLLFTNRIKY